MKFLLSIFLAFNCFSSFSQEPAHFFLGKEELSGAHIYDLDQDEMGNYWLATNTGLFKYDGYDFKQYINKEMTSNSLFNLCFDREQRVYCNNLSGQIFRVNEDSCELFFQIPDTLIDSEISIDFDQDGDLLVLAHSIFYLNSKKEITEVVSGPDSRYGGGLNPDGKGGFYVLDYVNDFIHYIKDKKSEIFLRLPYEAYPTFFEYQGDLVAVNLENGEIIYSNNELNKEPISSSINRKKVYSDGEYFWTAHLTGGANISKGLNAPFFREPEVLKNHIISAFTKDHEGNVILGTFGDGMIVIPNMTAKTYALPDINDRPTKVVRVSDNQVVVGTQSGKLFSLNSKGELALFSDNNSKFVEFLGFFEASQEVIVDDKKPHVIHFETGEKSEFAIGAVKDGIQINDSTYIIATSVGVRTVKIDSKEVALCKGFELRTNAVGYCKETRSIYAGTALGLSIGRTSENSFFEIDNHPVLAPFISKNMDTIMVCTKSNGVLLFHDDVHIASWNEENGFPSNDISKMVAFNSYYIVKSKIGLFVVDNDGKLINEIKIPEGLTASDIYDFDVAGTDLYVTHSEGIQKIDLNSINEDLSLPSLRLENIELNEIKNEVWEGSKILSANENRIGFRLTASSLKYKDELRYKYRLSEIDKDWQYNVYEDNLIEYKSLPAGEYTFEYSLVCRGTESPLSTVSFEIKQIFWKSFWFWGLIMFLIVLATYFVYLAQTQRQKTIAKHEREAVESKLKAIQSQMNPHFIFNSLNSIQDLVLNQQGENAYNYISKFAFLVRKVLHFSEAEFISIDDELKMLEVYLELEELRFDEREFKFTFELDIEDDVEIPPMVIQPFVENAIKHGLLHKEDKKELCLRFEVKEELLLCDIEDNGVGRARSKVINQRKRTNHESFSTNSIQNRFEILQNIHGGKLGVKYIDKVENGKSLGTIVKLQIPIKRSH